MPVASQKSMFKSFGNFSRQALTIAMAAAVLSACSVLTPRQTLPISEVVDLSQTGAPPAQVISKMRTSKTSYALRGSDFPMLADAGVQPEVLDRLQQSFVDSVDLLTRYWVLGESLGGCTTCYPQPVDLASLQSGGDGMADASNVHRMEDFSRPRGVPAWVPSNPGRPTAPGITVDEIASLAREGMAADELVQRINNSRLHDVVATGGIATAVGTTLPAGLSGSQLASLGESGVPAPVLDALQAKFLAEWVEFARLRYQNLGKGSKQPS
ncbi:MAG: hypothetical protein WDZ63_12275 [Burkholderiales bacterium]